MQSLRSHLGAGFISQRGGEVALASGAGDGDNQFAGVFRALGDFDGSDHVGTGADADQNAFFLGETASHGEGFVIADLDALGDLNVSSAVFEMEIARNESGTGSLDLVRAGLHGLAGEGLIDDRGCLGLDGDGLEAGLARLEDFGHTSDRTTRTDSGDEDVDLAIGVGPQLFSGGFRVNGRIGRIFKGYNI